VYVLKRRKASDEHENKVKQPDVYSCLNTISPPKPRQSFNIPVSSLHLADTSLKHSLLVQVMFRVGDEFASFHKQQVVKILK